MNENKLKRSMHSKEHILRVFIIKLQHDMKVTFISQ